MENLTPVEPQLARRRLTDDEAQELVLRTVAAHAESLLRTAYRHSLCADDAHDAYQRAMEILLRRVHRLDPETVHKWIHVVVKHEAMDVRRTRSIAVAFEDIDFDRHESPDVSSPEDRAMTVERTTRAAEALRRLKPHELRAMWLKAMGHSYTEISHLTGFSATKVNRCLTEGRKSFLERFEGIETGAECQRWQPVLSAMVDGEATAAQLTEARPHLRNCPACRATLRGLHESSRPLSAVLPAGLFGAGAKLSGLLDRILGSAAGADPTAAAGGGAGVLGLGGMKLAGVLAAGAAATAGGGLVAAQHVAHETAKPPSAVHRTAAARAGKTVLAQPATLLNRSQPVRRTASATTTAKRARRTTSDKNLHQLAVRRDSGRIEFAPVGDEPASSLPKAVAAAPAPAGRTMPSAPRPAASPSASADSSSGEFAPQP